jgi:hypothetical protein
MSAGKNFDTREKIVSLDQARAIAPPAVAFVTHLEVLGAAHVRKLEELAAAHPGKLLVILTDPQTPLVPLPARAELAAALRVVDYVIPAPEGAGPVLAGLHPGVVIHDEQEDTERTRLLIEHVRSRAQV